MICPKCQKELEDGTKFCPDCGTEIVTVEYQQPELPKSKGLPTWAIVTGVLLAILCVTYILFNYEDFGLDKKTITNPVVQDNGIEITQRYFNYSEDVKVYYDDLVNDPMNSEGKYTIISGRVIDILGDGVMIVSAEYNTAHPIYVKFPTSNGAFGTNDDIIVYGISKNLTDYSGKTMPYIDAELVDRYIN